VVGGLGEGLSLGRWAGCVLRLFFLGGGEGVCDGEEEGRPGS